MPSFSRLAIRNHIGTLMLTLALVVLGVFFIFRLQVDLLPSITYPRIGLRVDAPGISPEVAIEEITKPLEEAMSATEGVIQVYSSTREGRISLDLFFALGENVDQALNEATASLSRARSTLPDSIEEPRLFKFDPSRLPVYEFALRSSTLSPLDLRIFAEEELSRELSIVSGVAAVDVSGGVNEEVQVNLDLQRLQAVGVGLNQVLSALEDRNLDTAGGRLEGEAGEPVTRTRGKFQSISEIENLALNVNSERIYLKDVANIVDGSEEQRIFVSLNGKPAVKVSIQKQPDANTIAVVDNVKKRLAELRSRGLIPENIDFVATTDESIFIRNAISNVISSGLVGAALAGITVLFFLKSLRQTLIILIAIPLASLTAIILMQLFGLSLNVFSLGGLALGVGIVVDNSIVMLENIALYLRSNHPDEVIHAAEQGSQEVESALIASTATNLVSVVPFLLIGGFFSLLFNEIILTISFAVAASLLGALTVVPVLSSRLFTIKATSGISKFWLLKTFNQKLDGFEQVYTKFLAKILQYRWLTLILAFIILGGSSLWMFQRIPQEIIPRINTGQANLFVQFPPGTTLKQNVKVMTAIDQILLKQPETEYVFTTSGGALFGNNSTENLLRGTSTITFKEGTNVEKFVEQVNPKLNQLNLVDIRVRLTPGQVRGIILTNSPVNNSEIDLILQSQNEELLNKVGQNVLNLLDEKVDLARFRPNADPQETEIQIKPDWTRIESLGLSAREIGETIQTAIEGTIATELQRGDRLVDIRVQLAEQDRNNIGQLANIPLFLANNSPLNLRDIANFTEGQTPAEIQRINQRQVFIISGNLAEGAKLSEASAQVQQVISTINFPEGVNLLPSSTAESTRQLQSSFKILGGLAIFLVFVVMAVQYNSLIDPLIIILTVPLALAGGIWGLFITQTPISAMVVVGAVLLVGIVVNNAIIMVELANQLKEQYNLSRRIAILKAAPQRLRPILMTTITTVLGLFPLALGLGAGGEFLQPLGVVVFSGLSLATLLTLFIIPCFYILFSGK
ncbi:cation transporter [Aphanothece hegewaldii CCALA 016]|uniref:Cation transporter n=1 Tax=Aphanothece hegewaldii CCALA 016 TaxID=2107694 RepID=A0A2T1LXS9_9CHRO|nr:efflux RND transporter permease subunit [Aphanothece hegewaldii]PSF37198.1 cation transporter [Aphanothece hegewaldii CCALA 016]